MSAENTRKGLLERLAAGPVIGDGGMTVCLERRGYTKAAVFTPESTVLHPDAVRQLHRDFARSGADVCQAFNFYANESTMTWGSKKKSGIKKMPSGRDINIAAYRLAREVADEYGALVSISLSETKSYVRGEPKDVVQAEFEQQLSFFREEGCDIDFIVCEYFAFVDEMEWAIEVAKGFGKPVAATMCIGPISDKKGVSTGECAVRMCKAGADVVGVNCKFGPNVTLEAMAVMKAALEKERLNPYLMCQPLGFYTPDVRHKDGYLHLPELFLAFEPRVMTRFEAQKFARQAYDLGVHYIGGCCAFEPQHIRAMSEELQPERKKVAEITEEYGFILDGLAEQQKAVLDGRGDPKVWRDMEPSTGRPRSTAFATNILD